MRNVDPETGIHYGVVDARKVEELWHDIESNGENETWEDVVESTKQAVGEVLGDYDESMGWTELQSRFRELVNQLSGHPDDLAEYLGVSEQELTFKFEEVVSYFLEEDIPPDECVFTWENEGAVYETRYLGGAPLVFVRKSPYVVDASGCSPCVPNAGDLENSGHLVSYCPPPAYYNLLPLRELDATV